MSDVPKKHNLFVILMELRSLEMHFMFSYLKTKNSKYLESHDLARKERQQCMKLIGISDKAEDWCSSKHMPLLVNLLFECAAKEKDEKLRKKYLEHAWFWYGLFWALNNDNGKS